MSRESILARGRTAAEAGMVDTCTIRRVSGSTTDPGTGVITPTYAVIYTGPCRIQQRQASATAADAGDTRLLLLRLEVHLPMSVIGLQTEDEVSIDTSVHDPDLPGRVFLVRDPAHKTHATARRVGVQERIS